MVESTKKNCWVCASPNARLVKKANYDSVSAIDFRITDAKYGVTSDIYQCGQCGFLFCPNMDNLLSFYEDMEDQEYEDTRQQRSIQLRSLLNRLPAAGNRNKLLDVGAGSGILVEEALAKGFDATGVEPSHFLAERAKQYGLPIINDQFPSTQINDSFDIITLVDIIEHVDTPKALMQAVEKQLKPGGICVIVTPDVKSLVARILGWRWWHFRVAHVGYFNKQTLSKLVEECGLEIVAINRPGWYFPGGYLFERVLSYLPGFMRIKSPQFLNRITVPLNLGDSLLFICRAKRS